MADGKEYVQRGMLMRCSHGSLDNYINVGTDHGVLIGDQDQQPLMNANDHDPGIHIMHFGTCDSDQNPERMVRKGVVGMMTGGLLFGGLVTNFLEDIGIMSFKCTPKTDRRWENANEKHIVDGAPALTMSSCLTCRYGGVIEMVPLSEYPEEEQEDKGQEEPQEEQDQTVRNETAQVFAEAMGKIAAAGEEGEAAVALAQMEQIAAAGLTAGHAAKAAAAAAANVAEQADSAWAKALLLAPAQQEANYEYNLSLPFPEDCMNPEGLIMSPQALADYRVNSFTADKAGCGALAAYNTMRIMEPERSLSFPQVIRDLEPYGMLDSEYGMMPSGIGDYMVRQGYGLQFEVEDIGRKAAGAAASVLLMSTREGTNYITMQSSPDGDSLTLYDAVHGRESIVPVAGFEEALAEQEAIACSLMTVSRNDKL